MNEIKCTSCQTKINNGETTFSCPFCNFIFCARCARSYSDFSRFKCIKCGQISDLPPAFREQKRQNNTIVNCSHLVDVRVIQRDLVYIVGIPIKYAHEDTLLKYEFFGQYGPIKKVVVNSSHIHSLPNQNLSVSAYITFRNYEDAMECIYSLENFVLEGNQLKASFGTTKYCSSFLRGQRCTNPECMYLHHSGEQSDSFSKDEITGSSSRFVDITRPTRPPDYNDYLKQDKRPTILPPRRIMKKASVVIKKAHQKTADNSSFFDYLNKEEKPEPIVFEDHPGVALNVQLRLGGPSVRSVFNTLLSEQ
ncbi:myb-like protein Q isoform X1 [Histomonas meleagridis]|uniref:myb-like protein Q isoform X1 n=1 Tax=Histomonas meleagridis TaxID=135588 RepID=UPI00355A56AE|nr:myb-like protein Q isoform X1 [Histomonas meleagridis]KAH0798056.1 myb-like protein Q isoform X1 [Histomonas meleagridis]